MPSSIISYAQRDYSNGGVYGQLMEFVGVSQPSYVYTKSVSILSRYQCMKHKLPELLREKFDEHLSERQNMENSGWHRLYDCGCMKFKWEA